MPVWPIFDGFQRGGSGDSDVVVRTPELIPPPLKPPFVNHLVKRLAVGVEFEAELADLVLLDFDIDGRQIAAEDEYADSIRHPLKVSHSLSRTGNGPSARILAARG
jgi:hypothetical protein